MKGFWKRFFYGFFGTLLVLLCVLLLVLGCVYVNGKTKQVGTFYEKTGTVTTVPVASI